MSIAGPLISVDALKAMAADPGLVVADVRWYLGEPGRGRAGYDAGHIPGAVFVDVDATLTGPTGPGRHPLPSPEAFVEAIAALGIGRSSSVVAYDDVGGWVAARLWWMLDVMGHERVAVLDGGYPAWLASGFPTTTDEPVPRRASDPLPAPSTWPRVVDREAVRDALGEAVLLDARSGPRYRGEIEPIDPIAGHIPTAISAPTDGNLGPDGRFLPPAALRERFTRFGASADGTLEVIASCGSGISACQNALALRVAGLPDPLLYEGSYSDWSRSGEPVAVGPEPGDPPA